MTLASCTFSQAPEILAILNEAILNSTALYDYKPRTMEEEWDYHMMIGGIDSTNEASVRLHKSLGFTHCASIRQEGYKFGRRLDLEFHQLLLPGPVRPVED